ncbi:hypothetical protein GGS20DRAFT_565675 [Poronia punctata]|nr:hypothetical protein GGS20DRAFT_565675 [Poronia punctata]
MVYSPFLHSFISRPPLSMAYRTLLTWLALGVIYARAQRLAYTSFAVTECVPQVSSVPGFGISQPSSPHNPPPVPVAGNVPGSPVTLSVSYTMPPCLYCNCPSCTVLSTFATAYPAFCTGLAVQEQKYAITETYLGLSSLPHFASPTTVPFGFTARVETCEVGVCATEAITATITYPSDSGPYVAPVAATMSLRCGGEGAEDCSTRPTHYVDPSITSSNIPETTSVSPKATSTAVVTAGGDVLKGSFTIAGAMFLIAALR